MIMIITYPRSGTHLMAKLISNNIHFISLKNNLKNEIIAGHYNYDSYVKYESIYSKYKKLYVCRDIKDVLLSVLILRKMIDSVKLSITDRQVKGHLDGWKRHINNWKQHDDKLIIRYENLLTHYNIEKEKISTYLEVPLLPELPKVEDIEMSRKGIIGDHKNYFSDELINDINVYCKDELIYINKFLIMENG